MNLPYCSDFKTLGACYRKMMQIGAQCVHVRCACAPRPTTSASTVCGLSCAAIVRAFSCHPRHENRALVRQTSFDPVQMWYFFQSTVHHIITAERTHNLLFPLSFLAGFQRQHAKTGTRLLVAAFLFLL